MITTKYINARNNLAEHLNELDHLDEHIHSAMKERYLQEMEKIISDISTDCFTFADNYQNIPLFEQIKDLVIKIKDKIKDLRNN